MKIQNIKKMEHKKMEHKNARGYPEDTLRDTPCGARGYPGYQGNVDLITRRGGNLL